MTTCLLLCPTQRESVDRVISSVYWLHNNIWHMLVFVQWSPSNTSLGRHNFYSRWLTCGSCLLYPHLPERVMRRFVFLQFIPRHPSKSAPPTVRRRDLDVTLNGFYNHLVSENECSVSVCLLLVHRILHSNTFHHSIMCHILTWRKILQEPHLG